MEHRPALINVACKIVHNAHLAEDLADEAIENALFKADQRTGNLRAWLRAIVVNLCRHHIRDTKQIKRTEHDVYKRRTAEKSPLHIAINKEVQKAIDEALTSLTEKQLKAFKFGEIDQLPYKEVAQLMGLRCGAVRALAFRARTMLSKKLARFIA